jgi:hypothetical protein
MNCASADPDVPDAMPGTRYVLAPDPSVIVRTVVPAVSIPKAYFFSMGI